MNKHVVTPLLKFVQKILTKLINYYKYLKSNILPERSIHPHGYSTEIFNLPNCYQRFKEEEMDKCYNTFKKHFYNAVFLETKQLQKYSINEALKNDNESSELYYLEFGVGAGSSINYFSDFLKSKNRSIVGFDSFIGLKEDWKGHVLYPKGSLSQNNIQPKTKKNVILVAGWIQDTLPLFLKEKNPKINFLHIDVDTYESTKFILKETKQYLSKNCIIVFDDFYNFSGWSVGEYKALIEEFNEKEYNYIAFSLNKGNVAIQLNL